MNLRASSAQRVALCPGSARAESGLPETTSADAARGNVIHAIQAARLTGAFVAATPDDIETADALWAQYEKLRGGAVWETVAVEIQFERDGWTGHPDAVMRAGDGIHVIDWKSGWGEQVSANANAQLRVYAVLVAGAIDVRPIFAHLVTPRGSTTTVFDEAALEAAFAELRQIAEAAARDDAPRNPGAEQCRWCKAYGTDRCTESLNLPAKAAEQMPAVAEQVSALPAKRLSDLLSLGKTVKRLVAMLEEEAKVRLEADASSVPGWALEAGGERRSVTDAGAVFARLADYPDKVFFDSVSVQIPALEKAFAVAAKMKAGPARAKVAELLGDLIETKPTAPRLKEVVE